ncbi:hypothetical protein CKAN_00137200 [Cinnamomum micranthum f. kanehirae]|uniref:Uncharacterized protein n=1 Tax=Cinnamomum micranthum f. kanehirae TaxID=337451 RepID=A0A3S3MG30_9MAGN|nr:hypothetical protein CKAN_00137200 [Cinnamomum micranthum f. kanehirae]
MGCSVSKMEFRLTPQMKIRPPTGTIDEIAIQYSEERGVEEMKVKVCNERDEEVGDLGAIIGPSSPSFRVYFRNSFAESEDGEKAKGTSNGMNGIGMQSSVSKIPNEVLETKLVKKERGRRQWTFPKTTVAVYSFLHIRSDRRGLLIGKVA